MPSFVKVYVGCVLISQSGYPSIPPGFVSWPRSYSQSLFPSLCVSIQDFPAFCPARRMKPGIRPQGSFSLNGQEWRRTPRCKPYFSRLCRRISTLLQVIFFFTHNQCITSHSLSSCHSTDILHSECAKYICLVTYWSPRQTDFSASKWAYYSLLERGIFLIMRSGL